MLNSEVMLYALIDSLSSLILTFYAFLSSFIFLNELL